MPLATQLLSYSISKDKADVRRICTVIFCEQDMFFHNEDRLRKNWKHSMTISRWIMCGV